jgi:hypothetical protein
MIKASIFLCFMTILWILILNPSIAIVFFMFSPLFPYGPASLLNIIALNDILIFFMIAFLSISANNIFGLVKYKFIIPKQLRLGVFLVFILLLAGALRIGLFSGNTLFKAIVSDFFRQAFIISIYIFAYNLFKNMRSFKIFYPIIIFYYLIIGSFFLDKLIYGIETKMQAGFIGTGNTLGNILVVSTPLLTYLASLEKNIFVRSLPLLSVMAILFSGSRGSMLALFCMAAFVLIINIGLNIKIKILIGVVIFFIVFFSYPYFFEELHYKVTTVDLETMSDTTVGIHASGRFTLWSRAYSFLLDPIRFWVGGAPNTFLQYSVHNVQNHFLKIWVDYGLIGLIIVLNLYLQIVFICYKGLASTQSSLRTLSTCTLCSFIGLSIVGMFSHFEIGSKQVVPFWILTGFILAENKKSKSVGMAVGG